MMDFDYAMWKMWKKKIERTTNLLEVIVAKFSTKFALEQAMFAGLAHVIEGNVALILADRGMADCHLHSLVPGSGQKNEFSLCTRFVKRIQMWQMTYGIPSTIDSLSGEMFSSFVFHWQFTFTNVNITRKKYTTTEWGCMMTIAHQKGSTDLWLIIISMQ